MSKKAIIAITTIFLTILIDQWIKVYIKLNFYYGENYEFIGEWFNLHFVENPGMAFGWEFPFLSQSTAKLLLSIFRLAAVGVIVYYLVGLIKRKVPTGLIISVCLIFAGAFGNIIDSLLYGLIFSDSPHHLALTAEVVPFGDGYADFLTGKVVDMFYLDLFTIDIPWFTSNEEIIIDGNVIQEGGWEFMWKPLHIFDPIFNFADVAISAGVVMIILFQRKSFQTEFFVKKEKDA